MPKIKIYIEIEDETMEDVIDVLKKQPTLLKETRTSICKNILEDILENIYNTYKTVQKTEKSSPCDPSDISLSHFIEKNNCPVHRILLHQQKSTGLKYELTHLKVHQQFVGNLCGYYAMFYIKESIKMIKSQDPSEYFNLLNPAQFWLFHFRATKFLQKYAQDMKFDQTKYPWTPKDLQFGDLERAFVDPLLYRFPEMRNVVESTSSMDIKIFNYQFQFKRFTNSYIQLQAMQTHIDKVRLSKEKNKHYLTFFMLGVTNHWAMFCAHKFNDRLEFWFMDSRNRDYLLWSQTDAEKFYNEESERRKKDGRKELNSFQIWVNTNNVLDFQISLKLLVGCFLGNTTLYQYSAESGYEIIRKEFTDGLVMHGLEYPKSLKEFQQKLAQLHNESYQTLFQHLKQFVSAYGQSIYELITIPEKFKHLSDPTIEDLRLLIAVAKAIATDKRNVVPNNLMSWFKANVLSLKF